MKVSLSSIVALVLFLSMIFVDASVEEICRKVPPPPGYDYCVRTLRAIPGSGNADVQGLAIITTNLVRATYTHNIARARELLKNNLPARVKVTLHSCVEGYQLGISDIDDAIVYIKSHDLAGARTTLSGVEVAAVTCIDSWNESKQKPMMRKENEDALNISMLALDMTYVL